MRTNSNILLACLAGSDLFAGLVVHPVAIAVELKRILGDGPCTLEKVSAVALVGVSCSSFNHLLLIGIDHYVAIKRPLRYREIVPNRRIKIGVFSSWVVALLATIEQLVLAVVDSKNNIYLAYVQVTDILSAIVGLLYIAVMSYIYGYIFLETRRQKKRLQTEQLTQEEAKRVKKDNSSLHPSNHSGCVNIILFVISSTSFSDSFFATHSKPKCYVCSVELVYNFHNVGLSF